MEWVMEDPSALVVAGSSETWTCTHGPFAAVVFVGSKSCRTLLTFQRIPISDSTEEGSTGAGAIARATNTLEQFGRACAGVFG
jgi:hypothetical protein